MILTLSAVLLLAAAPATADAKEAPVTQWGAARVLTVEPQPLADAVAAAKSGSTVLVKGTAASVCKKKGCWVVLNDGDVSVRVTMKDYGFFLPKDVAGKTLVVEGVLSETVVTEKERRHFAKDEGKSRADVKAIEGDTKTWALVASSITAE